MHEMAIRRLDRAALELIQALDEHGEDIRPYLEAGELEPLRKEVVNLRRALLGLEMGALYWETPAEVVDSVVNDEILPIEDAAARLTEMLKKRRQDQE
jgi:hypothetical protein